MLSLSALGYWDYMLCPTLIAKPDTCRHSWHENMSNTNERNVLLSLAQGYDKTILMFLSGHSNTNHLHRCFNSLIRWETIHTVNKNKLLYTHSQNTHVLNENKIASCPSVFTKFRTGTNAEKGYGRLLNQMESACLPRNVSFEILTLCGLKYQPLFQQKICN